MGWIERIINSRHRNLARGAVRSVVSKSDPGLRDYLFQVTNDFFSNSGFTEGVGVGLSQVRLDGDPGYVAEMLQRTEPHDPDYLVFRAFYDLNSTVLDVGANWGYSVGSLRSVGVRGTIVSFEAIPIYEDCLRRIRDLDRGNYHFFMTALSSRRGVLKFTVPVVGREALTALTSASSNPHIEGLVDNIHNHITRWMPHIENVDLKFCQFEVPVDTLDSMVNYRNDIFLPRSVAALKVDVEGLEFEVLKGGESFLQDVCPLVMAEGGNRRDGLQDFMSSLGYEYFERSGDKIYPVSGLGRASNGFFAHTSKLDFYEGRGILGI